jgi:hypothetical protein
VHRVLADMRGKENKPESFIQPTSPCMKNRSTFWIEERTFWIGARRTNVPMKNFLGVIKSAKARQHLHGKRSSRSRILNAWQTTFVRREIGHCRVETV